MAFTGFLIAFRGHLFAARSPKAIRKQCMYEHLYVMWLLLNQIDFNSIQLYCKYVHTLGRGVLGEYEKLYNSAVFSLRAALFSKMLDGLFLLVLGNVSNESPKNIRTV